MLKSAKKCQKTRKSAKFDEKVRFSTIFDRNSGIFGNSGIPDLQIRESRFFRKFFFAFFLQIYPSKLVFLENRVLKSALIPDLGGG